VDTIGSHYDVSADRSSIGQLKSGARLRRPGPGDGDTEMDLNSIQGRSQHLD
jgi:hypothetical protein